MLNSVLLAWNGEKEVLGIDLEVGCDKNAALMVSVQP